MQPGLFVGLLGLCLSSAGCRDAPAPPASTAGASADPTQAFQAADEAERQRRQAVEQSLNPKGLPVYAGPVGGVRGVVTVSGDPPPLVAAMVAKLPPDACPRAHDLHRKLYRQGPGRTLADVLVTVTEYDGFVPPQADAVRVEAKGCAFNGRIIAMTYGQRLDVFNLDAQAYMPRLVGTPSYALRVAMPGGGPVPIFAPQAGQYMLVDQTRDYMRADVYVLNYPTFAVTGLDGQFEISRVPVGEVKVTAYAPAFGKVMDRRVTIQAGSVNSVSFDLEFSQKEYEAILQSKPEPAKE